MRLKTKLKTFFKTRDTSDHAVEFLRMWLLPFINLWDQKASIDDAIAAFFAADDRTFFEGVAKKNFEMPGFFMKLGDRAVKKYAHRSVVKGQKMLIAADRRDQTARVDIIMNGKEVTFLLKRPDFEMLKDCVEIKEA